MFGKNKKEKWHSFNTLDLNTSDKDKIEQDRQLYEKDKPAQYLESYEKSGRLANLETGFGKRLRAGLMAGAVLLMSKAGVEGRAPAGEFESGKADTVEVDGKGSQRKPRVEMGKSKTDANPESDKLWWPAGKFEWPGWDWTPGAILKIIERSPDGGFQINPGALLTGPGQFHVATEESFKGNLKVALPEEYARLFAQDSQAGKLLNPDDEQKIKEYIGQQLKQQLADQLWGLTSLNERYYQEKHGVLDVRNLEVKDIHITGFASPEGPRHKGPDTMKPENLDPENLELAKKRADDTFKLLQPVLESMGMSQEQIAGLFSQVDAKELEHSPEEMARLEKIADELGYIGVDSLEKIFNMTVDYNYGKILVTAQNESLLKELDQLIASKRRVEISIDYEGDKRRTTIIPIPWLLFLPLVIPLLRRCPRPGERDGDENQIPKPVPGERPPSEKPSEPELFKPGQPETQPGEVIFVPPSIPSQFRETEFPGDGSSEHQELEEQVLVQDIGIYFDNEKNRSRGLDYRVIANDLLGKYDYFSNDEERELYVSTLVIEGWKRNDFVARQEFVEFLKQSDQEFPKHLNWNEQNLSDGLDYENQPHQIKYARMHATIIVEMVERMMESHENSGGESYLDYQEILTSKIREAMIRRVRRSLAQAGETNADEQGEAKKPDELTKKGVLPTIESDTNIDKTSESFDRITYLRKKLQMFEMNSELKASKGDVEKHSRIKREYNQLRDEVSAMDLSEELPDDFKNLKEKEDFINKLNDIDSDKPILDLSEAKRPKDRFFIGDKVWHDNHQWELEGYDMETGEARIQKQFLRDGMVDTLHIKIPQEQLYAENSIGARSEKPVGKTYETEYGTYTEEEMKASEEALKRQKAERIGAIGTETSQDVLDREKGIAELKQKIGKLAERQQQEMGRAEDNVSKQEVVDKYKRLQKVYEREIPKQKVLTKASKSKGFARKWFEKLFS